MSDMLLFAVAPEVGHVFEGLALGLRYEAPYEPGSHDTDYAVEGIHKHMSEAISHIAGTHVVERHESRRYDEIEYPLESHRHRHRGAADSVGEDLGDQHPADGAP